MFVFKQREKLFVFLTGAFFLFFLWAQFILRPSIDYSKELDAALVFKNAKLHQAKNILGGTAQQLATKEFLEKLSSQGSPEEEMSLLIKEVETAATGSGLKVLETKPLPLSKNMGWVELKVSLAFEGRFSDVVRFLYQMEERPKPLLVNEMIMEVNLPQQETIRCQMEVGRLLMIKS